MGSVRISSLQENYGTLVGRGPLVLLFIDAADTAQMLQLEVLRKVASTAISAHPNLHFGFISGIRCALSHVADLLLTRHPLVDVQAHG